MGAFTGLSAFPITPCDAEGRLDAGTCAASSRRWSRRGSIRSGSREHRHLRLPHPRGAPPRRDRGRRGGGRARAAAGRIGALRTDEAIRLARDAKAAGAHAGLLAPSPTRRSPRTRSSPIRRRGGGGGLPLVIYDNPATTHFRFTPALIGRLARLRGWWPPSAPAPAGGGRADARAPAGGRAEGFPLGFSGDWNATEALIAGGGAWYSVAAGLFRSPASPSSAPFRPGTRPAPVPSTGRWRPSGTCSRPTRPCGSCTRSPGRCRRARSCPCRRR